MASRAGFILAAAKTSIGCAAHRPAPNRATQIPADPRNAADLGQDIEKSVQGTALLYIHLACVISIQQQ
jgi:hypothetical protein